jgi:hypothetical protein
MLVVSSKEHGKLNYVTIMSAMEYFSKVEFGKIKIEGATYTTSLRSSCSNSPFRLKGKANQ